MLGAIPIVKDFPDGLKESLTMEEVEIAHKERSGKTAQKNKMSIKDTDTIDPSKSAGHDLESLSIASTTNFTCKPSAAPVVALKVLDKNRHSSRARKSVGTYNVKALAGTAVHTPRKFNKDENGQDKAGSLKTAVNGKIERASIPSTSCRAASKSFRHGVDASVQISPVPQGQSNIANIFSLDAFNLPRFSANPFHRIKLVVKAKPVENSGPVHLPSPPESVTLDAASTVSTSPNTSPKKKIPSASEQHHKDKTSSTAPGGQTSSQFGDTMTNGDVGIKRAAPADTARSEPLAKKRKIQANEISSRPGEIIIYLTGNRPDSTHTSLAEELVLANSAVLKHVLESKADPDGGYDSDDELCYIPSKTKNMRRWATGHDFVLPSTASRAVFITPLLNAMLQELDDELPSLDKWDKDNHTYLQDLVNSPSAKIWELVQVWQGWVETGEVKLGRCPFQRERMLKFARVMETPVEFFRAVKKHEVDEKRFPTEHECEMWRNGLHSEQYVEKEDKELKEYWSPIGGHIHEYYEKRGL